MRSLGVSESPDALNADGIDVLYEFAVSQNREGLRFNTLLSQDTPEDLMACIEQLLNIPITLRPATGEAITLKTIPSTHWDVTFFMENLIFPLRARMKLPEWLDPQTNVSSIVMEIFPIASACLFYDKNKQNTDVSTSSNLAFCP